MQFRQGLVVIALLFFSITLGAGLAQTNLLSNGSFESPAAPAGGYTLVSTGQNLIPGWSVVGASGNVALVSGTFTQYGFNFPAQDGSQWLDLTGATNTATGVQQTVSTTAGTTYALSFWVGNVSGSIFGTTSTVNVLVNGTQILAAKNIGGTTTQNWQQFKIFFMATGSTTTIEFLNGDPYADNHNGFDNVVLIKVTKDDLLGTWDGQGVYFRNMDTGTWTALTSPADLIACGDLYGDGKDDLVGIWSGLVWVKNSADGSWVCLTSAPRDMAVADMSGDGRVDFLGTWDGQGVYYRDSITGSWVLKALPGAERIAAGDLDGDGIDDLIGVWAGQGTFWKSSKTGDWIRLAYSEARDIAAGDMNGDGRVDFLGTWDGQGVFYKDSISGAWVQPTTPAEKITAGDLDGDGTDDLIGIWTGQGIWAKYSKTGTWVNITTSARDIAAGKLSGGAWSTGLGSPIELMGPAGGYKDNPGAGSYRDVSDQGPRGKNFTYQAEKNLIPQEPESAVQRIPGPGEPEFKCIRQENLFPQEGTRDKNIKKEK